MHGGVVFKIFIMKCFFITSLFLFGCSKSENPASVDNDNLKKIEWKWFNPLPVGHSIKSVVQGNRLLVAVGGAGTIVTSSNGTDWVLQNSTTTNDLNKVIWAANMYVAVGRGGTVLTSVDGINWVNQKTDLYFDLNYAVYGSGLFVVGGYGASFLTSASGSGWSMHLFNPNELPDNVEFSNGVFVGVINYESLILHSTDGVHWRQVGKNSITSTPYLTSCGNLFFIYGNINGGLQASQDGLSWQEIDSMADVTIFNIQYLNDMYEATTNLGFYTSTNGIDWNKNEGSLESNHSTTLFFDSKYVGVNEESQLLFASNRSNWKAAFSGMGETIDGIAYGNGRYVAMTVDGTLLKSSNSEKWEVVEQDPMYLNGLWFDSERLKFVGNYFFALEGGYLAVSTDGDIWNYEDVSSNSSEVAFDIAYGAGQYVLVLNSELKTSSNGRNWQSVSNLPDHYPKKITYGNGKFVAADDEGRVFISTSGTSWTTYSSGLGSGSIKLMYMAGKFYLYPIGGFYSRPMAVSVDGINWEVHKAPYNASYFEDNNHVYAFDHWEGSAYRLENDMSWKEIAQPTTINEVFYNELKNDFVYTVVFDGTKLVGAGRGGAILIAPKPW